MYFFITLKKFPGVLILSALANNYRLHKLKVVDQFVMMYGGLRGAVAFALVLLIKPDVSLLTNNIVLLSSRSALNGDNPFNFRKFPTQPCS